MVKNMSEQRIICGDNLEVLKTFADNSVDSVVTDPPYGLSFMNKHWDYDVPGVELWQEVFRVLKPGGHLLSFGGTRTYHRMVVNIEDAGFDIRDQMQWIYGSGFPKSLDVSKAIDAKAGVLRATETKMVGDINNARYAGKDQSPRVEREITTTDAVTDDAKQWNGYGTALKPANEPIVMARKPISENTIAENLLKWGTGAIWIDGCRIPNNEELQFGKTGLGSVKFFTEGENKLVDKEQNSSGRFPANVIFDEAAAEMLDQQSGISESIKTKRGDGIGIGYHGSSVEFNTTRGHNDSGGASRFFYVAKPSVEERNKGLNKFQKRKVNDGRQPAIDNAFQRGETERGNIHPTVKPIQLMRYLVRLVTPPKGVCLDPYMGSGTTIIACKLELFNGIGIDRERE